MGQRVKQKVDVTKGNAAKAFIAKKSTDVLDKEDQKKEQQNININCNT